MSPGIVAALLLSVFARGAPPDETVVSRFLRYAKIDTQSREDADGTPSTDKQFTLARLLVAELKDLGLSDAAVDEHCFVYATLRSNLPEDQAIKIPVIGLISHMDTSPEVSGAGVNPVLHRDYQGEEIILPNDTTRRLSVSRNPHLKDAIGSDLITADGRTLLGADDKAGIAEIMTALQVMVRDPAIKHGTVAIAFTPDEETGTGIALFNLKKFGARYAYTVDGGPTGEINEESWNAETATITFRGKNTHPGTAKGIMVNSMYAAAEFLREIPERMKPEMTEKREGFIHPDRGSLGVEESRLTVILRNFEKLDAERALLASIRDSTVRLFPGTSIDLTFTPGYSNMKTVLDSVPFVVDYAVEACRRAGVSPAVVPVRGGTDGSDLSAMGLPCPNIFTGGDNFHGKLEWVSVRGMDRSVQVLLNLIEIWREKNS